MTAKFDSIKISLLVYFEACYWVLMYNIYIYILMLATMIYTHQFIDSYFWNGSDVHFDVQ